MTNNPIETGRFSSSRFVSGIDQRFAVMTTSSVLRIGARDRIDASRSAH
jgi:hypothetical protein